jgi:hypothetical protein
MQNTIEMQIPGEYSKLTADSFLEFIKGVSNYPKSRITIFPLKVFVYPEYPTAQDYREVTVDVGYSGFIFDDAKEKCIKYCRWVATETETPQVLYINGQRFDIVGEDS